MTTTITATPAPPSPLPSSVPARAALWLALGAALTFAASFRWGIGALAWFAPVPWLRYLRITRGARSRAAFAAAVTVTWIATTAKIVTAPLPPVLALVGVPIALVQILGYLGADRLRRRAGDLAGLLLFPAILVVLEWAQGRFTFLSTWGAGGYTQIGDLPVLQVASLFGLAGVSFLVYGAAAAVELLISALIDKAARRQAIAAVVVAGGLVAAAHVWGAIRLASYDPGETVRVAAVGTIATFGPDTQLTAAERAHILDTLAADTATAAHAGARLVVWTEASAYATPDEEPALVARARAIAAANHVHLVAAYVVPGSPRFQNELVWARPDGTIDHAYAKHHPAPGEPAVVGTEPIAAIDTELGRLGNAICYDYDYPSLAAAHGALGVDLVALPSSDWRGIDPIHTQMAAVRAIEQGVSIVRSTRFGLSAGVDPLGRLRAQASSFETDDRVLVVDLPRHGIATVYRRVGDVLVLACAALVLAAALRRRRATSSRA
jgi:apolipoprotein N-acyltransferase